MTNEKLKYLSTREELDCDRLKKWLLCSNHYQCTTTTPNKISKSFKKLVLKERVQRPLHKPQKEVKPIYGYKSRGYFESSPDEGKEWSTMDFRKACIILFLNLGTLHSCSFAKIHAAIHLWSIYFSVSVVLQNKFIKTWKINNPAENFNGLGPRTEACTQVGPANWDYRCQDRRQTQAIGGKYPPKSP